MLIKIALLTLVLAESKELFGLDSHQQMLENEDIDSGNKFKLRLEQRPQMKVLSEEVLPDEHYVPVVHVVEKSTQEQLSKEWEEKRQHEEWRENLLEELLQKRQHYELWSQEHRQRHQEVEGDGFCGTKHLGK